MENAIRKRLQTKLIGRQLFYYPSLTSTMEVAKEKARQGVEEGTVIIAGEQIAGRGRLGRDWLSPKGSLALSIIFHPASLYLPQLIMISSVAVVRAIKKITNLEAWIKWPNDVLIKGKKVCGILIENEFKGDKVVFSLVGIGINVNFSPMAFAEITAISTSLSQELGRDVSYIELVSTLLVEVEDLYLRAQAGEPIYEAWREHMETLGKWVRVKAGENIEEGRAEAVTKEGNLILRRDDGSMIPIVSGDVTLLGD